MGINKIIILVLCLISVQTMAWDKNNTGYQHYQYLNLSNAPSFEYWLTKSHHLNNKKRQYIELNLNGVYNQRLEDLIKVIDKDNESETINYLGDNFGRNYSLFLKGDINYRVGNFKHNIGSSASVWLSPTDPIFPEAEASLHHDLYTSISYDFLKNNHSLTIQLTGGERRLFYKNLNIDKIMKKEESFDYNNIEEENFLDLNFFYKTETIFGDFTVDLLGMPLNNRNYINYQEMRLGYFSPDLISTNWIELNLYGSLSPIYHSPYDWTRYLVLGAHINLFNQLSFDYNLQNDFNSAMYLKWHTRLLDIKIFKISNQYDDFKISPREELIGAGISFGY